MPVCVHIYRESGVKPLFDIERESAVGEGRERGGKEERALPNAHRGVFIMGVEQRDIDDLPRNPANYTALTPLGFLDRAALVHPTRNSLIHGSVRFTWHQTYRRCRQLASALAKRSVTFGTTVVRDKRTGKTKGYGFVSFSNPSDLAAAMKEMNGKYVGNRPIKLRKSTWRERTDSLAPPYQSSCMIYFLLLGFSSAAEPFSEEDKATKEECVAQMIVHLDVKSTCVLAWLASHEAETSFAVYQHLCITLLE